MIANESGTGSAFVIAGIGSLKDPRLRFAGAEEEVTLNGAFEILSLCGTLTPDGGHLHIAVSDEHGRVVGGHVCYGNEVRTTAEILLTHVPGWQLSREFDAGTGYRELSVRPVDEGSNNAT